MTKLTKDLIGFPVLMIEWLQIFLRDLKLTPKPKFLSTTREMIVGSSSKIRFESIAFGISIEC